MLLFVVLPFFLEQGHSSMCLMLFSHSFWNKAFPVATSTGSRRVVFLLYVYVCPWIPLSALAFGSVSFRPPSPLSLGLARLDQPSPPAHQDTHTHTHTQRHARAADSRAPIKRLAQGTDREANGREKDLVLELCWHGPPREKGAGRGTDTGGGGAGIPLRASKLKKGAGGGFVLPSQA